MKISSVITEHDFGRLMQEVCYLIGYPYPPTEQLHLFFEKLRSYDLRDFERACRDDDMLRELSRRKNLCWPVIKDAIIKYRIKREDREIAAAKRREEEEFRRGEIDPDVQRELDRITGRARV